MRRSLLLVFALTSACAGPRQLTAERVSLPEGEGVYEVRYNPPGCLADLPQLHLELRASGGPWERVYLEADDDEPQGVDQLLATFSSSPQTVKPVRGTLTSRVRSWAGQHASRVFIVGPRQAP
jgi:hypothetical protein